MARKSFDGDWKAKRSFATKAHLRWASACVEFNRRFGRS